MHLRPQQDAESTELEDGGWIISQSDGVGVACSVAYQFKRMAQADLAIYSGRCGHPGIHGKTNATYNTTEWNAIAAAVQNFGKEFSCVTGLTDILEKIDLSISGQLPQPIIIEMMDRAISSLQRGADLSTMSAGTGSGEGASVQDDESTLITADNCAMVTETLQTQLDPLVLAWHYGEDIEIKAGFELIPPESDTTAQDLLTDQALVNMGVKLSKNATLERYNRTEADPSDPDDSALTAPVTAGGIIAESSSSQSALVPSSPQSAPVSAENTTAAAVAKTSLNGAQVTALLDIIAQVESGEMSKDVAPAVMKAAFPLMSDEQIADMLPKSDFANEAEPSKGSPAPADGTDTPADRSGSPGIPDPAAAILNRAAAAILDGSVPFDEAMAAAIAELEKLPGAAADLPDTLEKTLTEAMFTAAANNIQETA